MLKSQDIGNNAFLIALIQFIKIKLKGEESLKICKVNCNFVSFNQVIKREEYNVTDSRCGPGRRTCACQD